MGDVATFIVIALLLVLGVMLGWRIGSELGDRAVTTKDYWVYNIGVLVAGMFFVALVSTLGLPVLGACGLGIMAGGLLGLKLQFGESVGPWKVHDKAFNINKDQQKVAEEGTGEERRRKRQERRKTGEEPQLISVQNTDESSARTNDKR